MMRPSILNSFVAMLALLLANTLIYSTLYAANSIGINFVGGRHSQINVEGKTQAEINALIAGLTEDQKVYNPNNPTAYLNGHEVTGMAGVGDFAQTNWNNVARYTETLNEGTYGAGDDPSLPDTNGSQTGFITSTGTTIPGMTVTWESENSYQAVNNSIENEDEHLMEGYLDISGRDRDMTVKMTGIPYNSFDLVVYVGSDGIDGRMAYIDVNYPTDSNSDGIDDGMDGVEGPYNDSGFYFVPNTGKGIFTGPDDYLQINAKSMNQADAQNGANYLLLQSVAAMGDDSSLSIRIEGIRDRSNAGIHGIQLIEANDLTLLVDTVTGEVALQNASPASSIDFDFDFYQITSESGALSPTGFRGMADQDYEGNGPTGTGNGWEEMGSLSDTSIQEGYLLESTMLTLGEEIRLGAAFTPGGAEDLVFRYKTASGVTRTGKIIYGENVLSAEPLSGDYNGDGIVNLADYTVWRDSLGSTTDLRANGNDTGASQGVVDMADYQTWKTNFGQTAAAGSVQTASVPEPSTACLLVLMGIACAVRSRRSSMQGNNDSHV
ncbi:hypothetical protein [Aeoliella mucimassa]|uniref:PEP-CTERM protein-sorting domain-containing protein n=1 Tax=Aeoliella mucimassa TaxID=2527972 RepID=A0A518AVC4_9BACT|nr:hypothetical protein [Aeoliella mucimassa]QDU58687.1 hypothetical protein Pan181_49270 [Aeoliella mucimassa]